MVHVWSINSGERFQGHHGPLVFHFKSTFKMLFAISSNLDQSKILSSGNGLKG